MKKTAGYTLKMSFQCDENWDRMPSQGNMRYCESCSRQLLDFTKYTDSQLFEYFKQHKKLCGRISSNQLDRILELPVTHEIPAWKRWILTFGLFGTSALYKPVFASPQSLNPSSLILPKAMPEEKPVLKGIVISELDGKPLTHVKVALSGTSLETTTDDSGRFEMACEEELTVYKLSFRKEGLSPVDFHLKEADVSDFIQISMSPLPENKATNTIKIKSAENPGVYEPVNFCDFRVYVTDIVLPIANVQIKIYDGDTLIAEDTTDADGRAVFQKLPYVKSELSIYAIKDGVKVDSTSRMLMPGLNMEWNVNIAPAITRTREVYYTGVLVMPRVIGESGLPTIDLNSNEKVHKNSLKNPRIRD